MRWLFESWYHLLPTPWAAIMLAPTAALCGAIVGMEREQKEKPAGIRTMALVCLGAALFTMTGFVFTSHTGDSGRVAAQVVTGIGFLGGGIILRTGGSVHGITTAATVWAVAATGMAVGAGYAGGGIGATALVLIVLRAIGRFERSGFSGRPEETVAIAFDPKRGKTAIKLEEIFERYGVARVAREAGADAEGLQRWTLRFRMSARHQRDFLVLLADMEEVRAIER